MSNYYTFFTQTNSEKPVTIHKNNDDLMPPCPFCDYTALAKNQDILQNMGESLLVANLYPTIDQTIQTVFIETKECDANFTNYDKETVIQVMKNFFHAYELLCRTYPEKQIIGLKNSGPFSSGSIHHQHMQLLVLEQPLKPTSSRLFEGTHLREENTITVNFSDKPATEFYEINVSISNEELFAYGKVFQRFCLLLQGCIQFALSTITSTNSYNLAFYFEESTCRVKILPRIQKSSVAYSPLLLAFDMHFVPDNLAVYRKNLQAKLNEIPL